MLVFSGMATFAGAEDLEDRLQPNDTPLSIDSCSRIIERGGTNEALANAHIRRGTAFQMLSNEKAALADYKRALELEPKNVRAYAARADLYAYLLNKFDEAISDYGLAMELEPRNANLYCRRGVVFQVFRKKDQAIKDYSRALELDPHHALSKRALDRYKVPK